MNLDVDIRAAAENPQQLEQLYQTAKEEGLKERFQSIMDAYHEAAPDNLLYAAWFCRLQTNAKETKPRREVNWITAVILSILTGLIFWVLSDFETLTFYDDLPLLLILWSPIATMSALVFMALTSKNNVNRAIALALGLVSITTYAIINDPTSGCHLEKRSICWAGAHSYSTFVLGCLRHFCAWFSFQRR